MPRLSLLLCVALYCPGILAAQEVLPPRVTGVVKNVDVDIGTITVRPSRKGATEDETFSLLKKDIEVLAPSEQKVPLDALKAGQTVQLIVGLTGDVEGIVIQAYVFLATVSAVNLDNRTIAIAGQGDQARTMAVARSAKILLTGRTAYLREVKPGSQMTVAASLDGTTALALNLVSDPDGKLATKLFPRVKTSRLPGSRWLGTLTAIDPVRNEVQLVSPKTKGQPKTIPVAKDAVIQSLYGQVAVQNLALSQIAKMAQATVLISLEDQQITRILVAAAVVKGTVKAVDADRGYLTALVDGQEKVFALPRDVKVMNKTRVMRLVDLQADLVVKLVLSQDRQHLLAIDISQDA